MKIEFDEATRLKARKSWISDHRDMQVQDIMAEFYAAAANRQLEASEKPAFEVGKKYRTRDGNIEGPLEAAPISNKYRDTHPLFCDGAVWRLDGQYLIVDGKKEHPNDLLPGAIEEPEQACVSPPLVEEIDWKARAEAAEKRAEKAEAALERVRSNGEAILREHIAATDHARGYVAGIEYLFRASGFSVLPAQLLKVIRHD